MVYNERVEMERKWLNDMQKRDGHKECMALLEGKVKKREAKLASQL